MHHARIIFLLLIFCNHFVYSQQNSPVGTHPSLPHEMGYQSRAVPSRIIDPATGKIFQNNSLGISGSPFFMDEWKYALLKLKDGRTFDMIRVKIDLQKDEVYFKAANEVEMVLDSGNVKEINFYDAPEIKNVVYKFQTGFPKIDNQDQNTFYQVICQGNIMLLKLIRKKVSVNKNDVSGETEKQFIAYGNYYIFNNNKMKRLKYEKDFILKALDQKKDKMEEFANQHSVDFKKTDDIITLFNYYNSLFLP